MKLVIVDCLRYDIASDPEIMPTLNKEMHLQPIYTVANVTEPSLASILIGDYPHNHGFMGLGQHDGEEILKDHLAYSHVSNWHLFSPAICFKPVTRFHKGKYYPQVKQRPPDETQIIHLMDVHDYKHRGVWERFYEGYEELVDETEYMRFNLPKEKGWGRPWEAHADIKDAGKLKAYYKAAAYQVDKFISSLLNTDELVMVTADHGEGFGEYGIVFRHEDLYDFMVKVPFACNKNVTLPTLPDHTDIRKIILGEPLEERRYSFQVENTWQFSFRVTDVMGDLIHRDPEHRIYDHPILEGDGRLKPTLDKELEKVPERPPSLIEGQNLSIG